MSETREEEQAARVRSYQLAAESVRKHARKMEEVRRAAAERDARESAACYDPAHEALEQERDELRAYKADATEIVRRLCYGASLDAMVELLRGSKESMKWLEEHDPEGALRYKTMWDRDSLIQEGK